MIAEHRLYYLSGLFDRVIYMENGRIQKEYTSTDIEKLSMSEQIEMGLRPFELKLFPLSVKNMKREDEILFSNFFFSYTNRDKALQVPSLSLPASNVIAIIGNNGAGKSTFARCICGLEKRCKGCLLYTSRCV